MRPPSREVRGPRCHAESTDRNTNTIENIYLSGSVSALTNWGTSNPILLSSANYPIWSSTLYTPFV